jgi:FMN phosphatase YigB (HAD superfamily)
VRTEAVIFDIGGVLELTPPTGWQQRWAARLDLDEGEFETRLEPVFAAGSVGQMSLPEVEAGIGRALALGRHDVQALMDDVWAEYLGILNEELADYFTRLRPRYRTGILSNSFVGAREREDRRYGFGEMCDAVVYSHEEGLLKPDPRFYRIACRRLGVPAGRCVFLDDTPAHVDGARAAGMRAIRFLDNDQCLHELGRLLGESI